MKHISVTLLVVLFVGLAHCSSNLLQNPSFDEAYSTCSVIPSWTQLNASNLFRFTYISSAIHCARVFVVRVFAAVALRDVQHLLLSFIKHTHAVVVLIGGNTQLPLLS